jgi:DNA-binding transcriptional ArsR family regulator
MARTTSKPRLTPFLQPELFRALADETRLAVLTRLAGAREPMTVSEIQSCCGVHLSGVSRHLSQLRNVGLVEAEKHGREVRYRLRAEQAGAILRGLADALEACQARCCVEEKP